MQAIDRVSTVTIAVTDQDEALAWYTDKLGFEKKMDVDPPVPVAEVAPPQQVDVEFLLASWFPDRVGKNATWVLSTRDCQGGYEELKAKGVESARSPRSAPGALKPSFPIPTAINTRWCRSLHRWLQTRQKKPHLEQRAWRPMQVWSEPAQNSHDYHSRRDAQQT